MKPIAPDEVTALKKTLLPDKVLEAINKVIAKNWNGKSSSFKQDEVVGSIMVLTGCTRNDVFSNKWLDFEDIYEAEGWKVYYDKPAYNETYDAYFKLTKK